MFFLFHETCNFTKNLQFKISNLKVTRYFSLTFLSLLYSEVLQYSAAADSTLPTGKRKFSESQADEASFSAGDYLYNFKIKFLEIANKKI